MKTGICVSRHSLYRPDKALTRCHRGRIRPRPLRISQYLSVDIALTSLLHALKLLERKQGVDGGMKPIIQRRRTADGAPGRGERWSRGERIEVRADKPSVNRHQGGRALLDNDGGFEVRRLRRSDGSHIHGATESIGGRHLVHVDHGLRRVDGLLFRHAMLRLGARLIRLHLPIEREHLGRMAGELTLLCRL